MAAIMLEKKRIDSRVFALLLVTCIAAITMTPLLSASRRPVSLASVSAFEKGASIQEKMARRIAQEELSSINKLNEDAFQDPDANIHFHASVKHKAKAAAVVPHHIELQTTNKLVAKPVKPQAQQMQTVKHTVKKAKAPAHKQAKAPAQSAAPAHIEEKRAAKVVSKPVQHIAPKAVQHPSKPIHTQAKVEQHHAKAPAHATHMLKAVTKKAKLFLGEGPWVHVPTPKEMAGDGVGGNYEGANGVTVNGWDEKAMTFHGDHDCYDDQKSGPLGCDVPLGYKFDNRRDYPNKLPTTYAPESGVGHHFLKVGGTKAQKLHNQRNKVVEVRQGLASLDTKRAARAPGLGMFAPVPQQALYEEVPEKKKCIGGEKGVCGDEILDVHTDRREADVGMPADKTIPYMYGNRPRTIQNMRMMHARTVQLADADAVAKARKEQESILGQMEDDLMEASDAVGSMFTSKSQRKAARKVQTKQQQLSASAKAEKKPGQSCIGLVCSDEVLDSMDNLQVDRNDVTTKGNNLNNYFFDKQTGSGQMLARPSYLDGGLVHHGISDVDSSADMNNFYETMPQQ